MKMVNLTCVRLGFHSHLEFNMCDIGFFQSTLSYLLKIVLCTKVLGQCLCVFFPSHRNNISTKFRVNRNNVFNLCIAYIHCFFYFTVLLTQYILLGKWQGVLCKYLTLCGGLASGSKQEAEPASNYIVIVNTYSFSTVSLAFSKSAAAHHNPIKLESIKGVYSSFNSSNNDRS